MKNDDKINVKTRVGKSTLKVIKKVAKLLHERMGYRILGAFGHFFSEKCRPKGGFKLPAANSRSWVLGKVREQTEICIRWNYLRSFAGFLRIDCKKRNKIKKIQPESIKLKQKLAKSKGWGEKKEQTGGKGRQK